MESSASASVGTVRSADATRPLSGGSGLDDRSSGRDGTSSGRSRRTERSKRKRVYFAIAVLAIVAAGGGAAAIVLNGNGNGKPANPKNALPAATAPITRGDVVDSESVDGKLTYGDEKTLSVGASGTVTWAPAEGATIKRGESLIRVDNKPVTLMYGSMPLYRTLSEGVDDGKDVLQLERNLKALGYGDDMTVDKEFTSATADAVAEWQEDRGLSETGSVDASQVVFQSGPVRVSDVKAPKGAQLGRGGQAMTVTGTTPIVHVDLDADKQDLIKKGQAVTVELPDGNEIKGRISKIGTVATESSGQDDDDTATVDVEISLSERSPGRLDQAPVSINVESDRAKNVLSVPIEALLALREGGFGVEVVEGATSRIVPVTLGTYGGGRVEITGEGLREGMKVGVPAQ